PQMSAPELRARISPDTIRNAAPSAATAIRSPTARHLQHRDRHCNVAVRHNEFHPFPARESSILRPLRGADLRLGFASDEPSSIKFPVERLGYASRNKTGDMTAEARDFFHDSGTEVSVLLLRHQENRFHASFEFSIHQRHLKFKFEIATGKSTIQRQTSNFSAVAEWRESRRLVCASHDQSIALSHDCCGEHVFSAV